jgi:hypothetical protein
MRKNILFIGGSINQTSQMHQIAMHLPEYDCYFTPYYADGIVDWLRRRGLLEFTILGAKLARRSLAYLETHDLPLDYGGTDRTYDLVLTCADLIVPKNIRRRKLILVQEGMTDPEDWIYHLVRALRLPRYLASTSMMGLSNRYDYFCVASEGYRELFVRKGVDRRRLVVTGIPNFDDCERFHDNDFPHHGYVLVCTSDARETFKYENRRRFIERCVAIADGRPLIFKLHPNENVRRAVAEIERWAPGAAIYTSGNTDHMIANCDVLVTLWSTVVYVGLALGKEVYSAFDLETLRALTPIQNGGISAQNIADLCRAHIEGGSKAPALLAESAALTFRRWLNR